jgi:hypothetical protein
MLGAFLPAANAQATYPNTSAATPVAYNAPQPNWNYGVQRAYSPNYQMAATPAPAGNYAAPAYGQNYAGYRVANVQPAQIPANAPPAAPAPPAGPASTNGAEYTNGNGYANGGGYVNGGDGGPGCQTCGGAGCVGCGYGGCGLGGHGLCGYFRSPCGMVQHYPYYPAMHGYYYLHPYHYTHVPAHQAFMARAGVDPRNPYSNDLFKTLYAEYRAGERGRTLDRPPPPESTQPLPTWPR